MELEIGKTYANKKGKLSTIVSKEESEEGEEFEYYIYKDQNGFEFIYDGSSIIPGYFLCSDNDDDLIKEV